MARCVEQWGPGIRQGAVSLLLWTLWTPVPSPVPPPHAY